MTFIIGGLTWTLVEYVLHRFAHWTLEPCPHHVDPQDYNVGPSWLMIVLWLVGLWAVAPWAFAAGFTTGYVLYTALHFTMHHRPRWYLGSTPVWLRTLRHNHNSHHFIDETRNYGVTSPLWDVVFGTRKRP